MFTCNFSFISLIRCCQRTHVNCTFKNVLHLGIYALAMGQSLVKYSISVRMNFKLKWNSVWSDRSHTQVPVNKARKLIKIKFSWRIWICRILFSCKQEGTAWESSPYSPFFLLIFLSSISILIHLYSLTLLSSLPSSCSVSPSSFLFPSFFPSSSSLQFQ